MLALCNTSLFCGNKGYNNICLLNKVENNHILVLD